MRFDVNVGNKNRNEYSGPENVPQSKDAEDFFDYFAIFCVCFLPDDTSMTEIMTVKVDF
jgi:hypothetical protein